MTTVSYRVPANGTGESDCSDDHCGEEYQSHEYPPSSTYPHFLDWDTLGAQPS